jgi:hypothetical protein
MSMHDRFRGHGPSGGRSRPWDRLWNGRPKLTRKGGPFGSPTVPHPPDRLYAIDRISKSRTAGQHESNPPGNCESNKILLDLGSCTKLIWIRENKRAAGERTPCKGATSSKLALPVPALG